MCIFLDNNSTTPIDPRVITYAKTLLTEFRANTTSSHVEGLRSSRQLETCRQTVGKILSCAANDIVFTSSSTEANNMILQGFILHRMMSSLQPPTVACCVTEHVSVLNPLRYWSKMKKVKVVDIPVDVHGVVDHDAYENLLSTHKIDLVTVSHINNEVGTVQDIRKLCATAHRHGAFFHTDATQSVGKVPLLVRPWKLDAVSWSSHKLYSVGGAGGLCLSPKFRSNLQQLMYGNDNEHKLRPGSVDLFSVLCMVRALSYCHKEMSKNSEHILMLVKYLLHLLSENNIAYRLNSGGIWAVNLSFYNSRLSSDGLIANLSKCGICVSKGSACKSRSAEESYVLDAMGLSSIKPTLRIGIGKFNTTSDIEKLVKCLKKYL